MSDEDARKGYEAARKVYNGMIDKRPALIARCRVQGGDLVCRAFQPVDLSAERIAADESLLNEEDARWLAAPPRACGIFNIKLMKCGGIRPALRMAAIAQAAGVDLMWGCMDESRISIAAALHAALSCPATRYLDLDGSLSGSYMRAGTSVSISRITPSPPRCSASTARSTRHRTTART